MKLTKQIRILDIDLKNRAPRIFDDVSGLLFWDDINNKAYYDLCQTMRGNFWVPDEVSMSPDQVHWNSAMNENEKELYKDGISVLASLDSIAAVFDEVAARFIRDAAIKANMIFIASMETIHNESYTYTGSSLMTKEELLEMFERPKNNPFIVRRNKLMMDIFDNFLKEPTIESFAKALVAMSGLEGVSFTNGFTPFYHFNRNNKMFGTGTIIQFIQRDEAQHSYFQTMVVRDIMTQYPELNTEDFAAFCYDFFTDLVRLEQEFCEDLYKNTPDIDLFEVKQYVGYRANLLLDNLGLDKIFEAKKNPMPWITAYDPDNLNNTKRDFFEDKEINYVKSNETENGWDEL